MWADNDFKVVVVDWPGVGAELRWGEVEAVAVRLDGCVEVVLLLLLWDGRMVGWLEEMLVCGVTLASVCLLVEVCRW